MKLSVSRYSAVLFVQYGLILADLVLNCVTFFPRSHSAILIMFVFQDLLLILAITAMLINLFSTYLFQAGLMEFLFEKFRSLMIMTMLYLCCCIATHIYWLIIKWDNPLQPITAMLGLSFLIQRTIAPCYYYFYKKAALRISDPRFYEDIDWINNQLSQQK